MTRVNQELRTVAYVKPSVWGASAFCVSTCVISSDHLTRFPFRCFGSCRGLSHYAGSVFTGSPLMLAAAAICAMLPVGAQAFAATALFTAFDVMSALLLRAICIRAVAVESQDW